MNQEGQMREHPKAPAPNYGTEPGIRATIAPMDNPQVSAEEIAWLAAFYEGEGSFGIYWNNRRDHPYPRTTLVNTDLPYIERSADILNRSGVGCNVRLHQNVNAKPHWKTRHDLFVEGVKRCKSLMDLLMPYLTPNAVKTKKAKIILSFCNSRIGHASPPHTPYTAVERRLVQQFRSLCERPAGKRRGTTSETRCLPSYAAHARKGIKKGTGRRAQKKMLESAPQ